MPAAALGRAEALAPVEAPAAPAALGRAEALPVPPTPAADGLLELVVEVDVPVVLVIGAAARMSMKTTLSPLLAMFMNVPAMAGIEVEEPLVADGEDEEVALVDEPVDALDEPLALELEVNEPFHWFCVRSCW